MQTRSVVVIGGGIIGLSIAWSLLKKGFTVTIFDKQHAGKQASWVAAGMLCPYAEATFLKDHFLNLATASLKMYPQFLQELERDSGKWVSFQSYGTLLVAHDQDEKAYLRHIYAYKKRVGSGVTWLSGEEARKREPLLGSAVISALFLPKESQVNNQQLVEALIRAVINLGGIIENNSPVEALMIHHGKFEGVVLKNHERSHQAEIGVLSAGAWTASLAADVPVYPMKGQIITATMPHRFRLTQVIRSSKIYIVPKKNGTVRIGATMEDVGFDESLTLGRFMDLLRDAWEVIPIIYEYDLNLLEVGFRPMTDNHLPIIQSSDTEGLYYATGHGRSGVLLAPFTAKVMTDLILSTQSKL